MGLGNRNNQHSFAMVPNIHTARSTYDRSYNIKNTFNFDYLVPIFVDEIIPGDTANLNCNVFARLATQKVPIMDNMYIDFFFFFVPCRLVWENWERFCGAQDNPDDSTDYIIPVVESADGFTNGSIYDCFGLPISNVPIEVNALPFRAYNLIWNTWFRDQNYQDSLTVSTDDGPDAEADYVLMKRNKKHDYITSVLPDPQRGPAVSIPLGTSVPVVSNNTTPTLLTESGSGAQNANLRIYSSNSTLYKNGVGPAADTNIRWGNNTGMVGDLANAVAGTINDLREAFQMQHLFEVDARGGTRYVEILRSHYNVVSPDYRLQRPEFLGGGSTRINTHPVPQTSPTSGSNAQGQLASFGTASAVGGSIGFTKSFVEHGYVIGLAAARADITYQGALNRMWTKSTRFEFFWPELQEIGEQPVYKQEINYEPSGNTTVIGYQERYGEYKYRPSEIQGQFRSSYAQSLDLWHLAEQFSTITVNGEFMESSTPIERCIADENAPHLLFDCWHQYKHTRPMMTYAVPVSLGRF